MKPKIASKLEHAIEAAGLATLAVPSIQKLRGKPVDEKKSAKTELAGLLTLAAPSAYHLLKKGSAMSPFAEELTNIIKTAGIVRKGPFEKTAGPFDRAARLAQEAKGVAAKLPAMTKLPGSIVRGKPMTGLKTGIDRAGLGAGKVPQMKPPTPAMGAAPKIQKPGGVI